MDYHWVLRNYKNIKNNIFKKCNLVIVSYPLGGRSDKNAIEGFL